MTSSRPRGRRPGRADTRNEILAAALKLFSEVGYDRVSLRSIAREADVDPALIHHYFENKADLFAKSVLALPIEDPAATVAEILDGPRDQIGQRAAEATLSVMDLPHARTRFAALLRASVTEAGVHRPMSEFLAREVYAKIAEGLGHTDAKLRGQLAVMLVIGFAMSRDILSLPELTKQRRAGLVAILAAPLQSYLADSWTTGR